MWDTLSRADVEAAKQQLQGRREQVLRRHAEEMVALDNEEANLETLNELIDALVKKSNMSVFEPVASSSTEPNDGHPENHNDRAGVSLLITQVQKSKLRELGIGDDEIRKMKPDEAHRLLGLRARPARRGERVFFLSSPRR